VRWHRNPHDKTGLKKLDSGVFGAMDLPMEVLVNAKSGEMLRYDSHETLGASAGIFSSPPQLKSDATDGRPRCVSSHVRAVTNSFGPKRDERLRTSGHLRRHTEKVPFLEEWFRRSKSDIST
jgi:hypothetical protein